jgi:hypothetical protein
MILCTLVYVPALRKNIPIMIMIMFRVNIM